MGIQSHAPDKVAALGALPLVVMDCLSVLVGLPHLGFRPLVVVDCLSARLLYAEEANACHDHVVAARVPVWPSEPFSQTQVVTVWHGVRKTWVSNPMKQGWRPNDCMLPVYTAGSA